MKFYFKLLILSLILSALASSVAAQTKKEEVCYNPNFIKDTSKKSIRSMAVGIIKGDSVKINYHSPGVHKRVIWGGLVPYNEVWVTGAHDATTIEINKPFIAGGKEIPAGKYALFTIPGKKEWIIILNKKWKQHLATKYDEKEDVARIKVKPIRQKQNTERLQYFIETGNNGKGTIAMTWETLKIQFELSIIN